MDRFLLFAWTSWQAAGGWGDYAASADTREEALSLARRWKEAGWDVCEVVDLETKTAEIVEAECSPSALRHRE